MIQFIYVVESGVNEIVVIAMMFSVLSIILSIVNQTARIIEKIHLLGYKQSGDEDDDGDDGDDKSESGDKYCRWCNMGHNNTTTVVGELKFECQHLRQGHQFANYRFSNCLLTALKSIDNSSDSWVHFDDILVTIQVFYIESDLRLLNSLGVHFEIEIFSFSNERRAQMAQVLCQQIQSFNDNPLNGKLLRKVLCDGLKLSKNVQFDEMSVETIVSKVRAERSPNVCTTYVHSMFTIM